MEDNYKRWCKLFGALHIHVCYLEKAEKKISYFVCTITFAFNLRCNPMTKMIPPIDKMRV